MASHITDFDGEEVKLKDQSAIPARTLIWTAGIQAAEITETLNLPLSANKRVIVEPTLQVPRHPEVFVIGDAAYWEEGGRPIPMVAPAAKVKGLKFKGFSAWLVWLVVHLMRLVGFRNRLVVLINWAWDYFFFERASRIIVHR